MERSQGFITMVFRALLVSRCKTRRKQVTRIPPTMVTSRTHTPPTPIDAPTSKLLAEDVTQAWVVAIQLTPATLEEEPMEEPSPSSDRPLGKNISGSGSQ